MHVEGRVWPGWAALGSAQPTVSEETLAEKEEGALGPHDPAARQPHSTAGQAGPALRFCSLLLPVPAAPLHCSLALTTLTHSLSFPIRLKALLKHASLAFDVLDCVARTKHC